MPKLFSIFNGYMRVFFSLVFILLMIILGLCALSAKRSKKTIGVYVAYLDLALIPPVMGKLILLISSNELFSTIGSYIYFIGMDFVILSLVGFAKQYCKGIGGRHSVPKPVYLLIGFDIAQLFVNPFTHHAFEMEKIMVEGMPYYRLIPYIGQAYHRTVCYGILLCIIVIFVLVIVRLPHISRERYSIILVSLVMGGLWQGLYIFSRTPIDRSTVGLAVIGILIYYFSIKYKPVRLLDRMLSSIVSEMSESLFVFDPMGKCIWANDNGCKLVGCDGTDFEKVSENLMELFGLDEQVETNTAERMVRINGLVKYFTLEECTVPVEEKKLAGSYLTVRDITEEKQKMKREMYNATHDRLTGLYVREYLYQKIAEKIYDNPDIEFLIIFINVRNFKIVNDIFGTDFGDHALKCIANWVGKKKNENCVYGRLTGDTFGALLPSNLFYPHVLEEELSHFVVSKGKAAYQLLIHLGVYTVDKSDVDVSVMFDRAHLSLSSIQEEYNTHIAYYDNALREQVLWAQTISTQLSEAIKTRQVRPYLQPIADRTGRIVGAEALARWVHPEHGFLPPYKFIPVFEKNGMITEVDRHMWKCACETLKKWQKKGLDTFISVNISPKDFYFMDVSCELLRLTEEYGIDRKYLRIEITETVMMNDADNRMQVIGDLRKAGFIVEMDDFGSGFSSLNMLKDMPVDVLKIDMKFLGKSSDEVKAKIIMKNIISLSEELGISSLTEGVETEEQFNILSDMGCRLFQGYYFSKPVPVEDFEKKYIKQ